MSRRRVPEDEKAVTWSLSATPSFQALVRLVAAEDKTSESAFVRQCVIKELKKRKKL